MTQRRTMDVEFLLEWTFRIQKADMVIERGIGLDRVEAEALGYDWQGWSACGCAAVERYSQLGCFVDTFGPDTGQLHPDAETVYRLVDRFPTATRYLLINHAKHGTQPSWGEGKALRVEPVWRNEPRWATNEHERRVPARRSFVVESDKHRNGVLCPVRFVNEPSYIMALQHSYWVWHQGLVAVRESLQSQLTRICVTGPCASAEPWRVGRLQP